MMYYGAKFLYDGMSELSRFPYYTIRRGAVWTHVRVSDDKGQHKASARVKGTDTSHLTLAIYRVLTKLDKEVHKDNDSTGV